MENKWGLEMMKLFLSYIWVLSSILITIVNNEVKGMEEKDWGSYTGSLGLRASVSVEEKKFLEELEAGVFNSNFFLKANPNIKFSYQKKIDEIFKRACNKEESSQENFLRVLHPFCSWYPEEKDNKKRLESQFLALCLADKKQFADRVGYDASANDVVEKIITARKNNALYNSDLLKN